MNEITIINGVNCYEENGTAYLKLEDVARGLGFTTIQVINGTEYVNVRWRRVDDYLSEFNFATSGKRPEYIPENIFYRLAMKAKNEAAEKFQAKVADEIIPSIRKTGSYSNSIPSIPTTIDGQIKLLAAGYTEMDKKFSARMDKLEFDIPLYGAEADELSGHVKRKGVQMIGGKDSEAYQDTKLRSQVYADIYGQLKREFGLYDEDGKMKSYKALKRKYLADAHEIIDCYDLPAFLRERIENANAQMSFA